MNDSKTSRIKGLDKARLLQILREADDKWYISHSSQFKYHEHLEFIAEYIAKNYHRKERRG